MGWLKPDLLLPHRTAYSQAHSSSHDAQENKATQLKEAHNTSSQHLERIPTHDINLASTLPYPFQPPNVPFTALPFIPSATVRSAAKLLSRTWIVVDDIVYDCTEFALEHPGGETVIGSFKGQDCSWQFWRFHNAAHMRDSGSPLRVGRTKGVENRFVERPRFVGLRRWGEEW